MTAKQKLRVSVFGHSFVRRLSEYTMLESSRRNLGLDTNFSVEVHGFGGLKLQDNRLHRVDPRLAKSDILFLELGSNDLCEPMLERFVRDLLSYASNLIVGLNIELIAISQIMIKLTEPFSGYNEKVHIVISLLKSELTSKKPKNILLPAYGRSMES